MNIRYFTILLTVTMLSVMCTTKAPKVERLYVDGTALMNESGDTVELKGMSFGWNVLWPRFYNADAVRHVVEDWDAELVRAAIGVEIDNSECQVQSYLKDPDFGKKCACTIVDAAVKNGVYVLVDWHAHGLHTDASFRYERGADPNITLYALKRAALLIKEIAGGAISSEIKDVYPSTIEPVRIDLRYSYMDSLIGKSIERLLVKNILTSLNIQTVNENEEGLTAIVPTNKVDVIIIARGVEKWHEKFRSS